MEYHLFKRLMLKLCILTFISFGINTKSYSQAAKIIFKPYDELLNVSEEKETVITGINREFLTTTDAEIDLSEIKAIEFLEEPNQIDVDILRRSGIKIIQEANSISDSPKRTAKPISKLISFAGIVPVGGGVGIDIGYHNLEAPLSFGFFSLYFGTGQNEVRTSGENYTTVGQAQFTEDIQKEGINKDWIGITGGINITKYLGAGIVLGYVQELLTQQRFDRLTILGDNGNYYTRYLLETDLDAGIILIGYINNPKNVAFTPSLSFTSNRGLSINFGFGIKL